jgi:hypothetical protein
MADILFKTLRSQYIDTGFLSSDFNHTEYIYIRKNEEEIYIKLRELELTTNFRLDLPGCALSADCQGLYKKTYKLAYNELIATKKVKGFEVLLLNQNRKVWISHYDWDSMEKL